VIVDEGRSVVAEIDYPNVGFTDAEVFITYNWGPEEDPEEPGRPLSGTTRVDLAVYDLQTVLAQQPAGKSCKGCDAEHAPRTRAGRGPVAIQLLEPSGVARSRTWVHCADRGG